jgi:hypothetical protein
MCLHAARLFFMKKMNNTTYHMRCLVGGSENANKIPCMLQTARAELAHFESPGYIAGAHRAVKIVIYGLSC